MAPTPGLDMTVALNVRTSGICWRESRFDWEVIDCVESHTDEEIMRTCAGTIPPVVLNRVYEDGPTQSVSIRPHVCPLTDEMQSAPLEIRITATEIGADRGIGGELCTQDLRTTTDVFTFVPVCWPEHDFCFEECFGS